MDKTIGVIIVSYGEGDWLPMSLQAYDSVIKQTVMPDEIRVVNIKSQTDLANLRNKEIENLSTEYFCILDADDMLHPDFIKNFHEGFGDIMNPFQVYVGEDFSNRRRLEGNLRNNPYIIVGAPARRDLFLEVGGFDSRFKVSEDYHLWCKMYNKGAYVGKTDGIYIIRNRPDGRNLKNGIEFCHQTNMLIRKEVFGYA